MDRNVGDTDKIIRIIVGVALIALGLIGLGASGLGILAMLIGAVLVVTGAINFCPLFKVLGINSHKADA